jgi:integrase
MEEEEKIAKGFDRDVDYLIMKQKLINEYNRLNDMLLNLPNLSQRRITSNKIIYSLIAMIQLINGSRISEAVNAFVKFIDNGFDNKVVVKIAKSKCVKYKRDTNEEYITPTRFRKMAFPNKWIDINKIGIKTIKFYIEKIRYETFKKRVLDYLLRYFDCNTHSLRYSFINYMLQEKKWEPNAVAKFVGHSNTNQLTRYTQQRNTDKIFDLDL